MTTTDAPSETAAKLQRRLLAIAREHFQDEESRAVVREALAWRDRIDPERLSADAQACFTDYRDLMARVVQLVAIAADPGAIGFVLEGAIRCLREARAAQDDPDPDEPISWAEYERRELAPYRKRGERLLRRRGVEPPSGAPPRPECQRARPRAHRYRARRAAGVRSGQDPGDDDPRPQRRTCEGCGEPFESSNPRKLFCSERCAGRHRQREKRRREREAEASEPLRPLAAATCECPPQVVAVPDEDGELTCTSCGRRRGDPRAVNGWDDADWLMRHNRGPGVHLRDGQRTTSEVRLMIGGGAW